MIGIGTKNHQYNIDEIESGDILPSNSHSTNGKDECVGEMSCSRSKSQWRAL